MARRRKTSSGGKKPDFNPTHKMAKRSDKSQCKPSVLMVDNEYDNDRRWYRNLLELFKDATNFSFNPVSGLRWNILNGKKFMNSTTGTTVDTGKLAKTAAGIIRYDIAPTIGVCSGPTHAPNVAANQIYAMVRTANSGAVNYDTTDIMLTGLSLDSAYMLYETLLRVYRSLTMYKPSNRYYPTALVQAMGFSMDLQKDMANFRAVLDNFTYKLASINFPDQFDLIKRHSWLFTNIYTDSPQHKAQMYFFMPSYLYVYKEGVGDDPTYLEPVQFKALAGLTGSLEEQYISTLDQISKMIDTIMNPILGSQDIGIISGDIAKAFASGGLITFSPVESYPVLEAVYSEEVMTEIENMEISGGIYSVSNRVTVNYDSTVSGPYLVCEPEVILGPSLDSTDYMLRCVRNSILNCHKNDPDGDDVMVATRFKFTLDNNPVKNNAINLYTTKFLSTGTEIVERAVVCVLDPTTNKLEKTFINSSNVAIQSTASWTVEAVTQILLLAQFDWAAPMYIFEVNTDDTVTFKGTTLDIDNYLMMQDIDVQVLNEVANMSLFSPHGWR